MKPFAADRPRKLAGWILVALVAAAMLALAGCGNDNELGGVNISYTFDPGGESGGLGETSGRMMSWNGALGEPVVQLVIGSIIVTTGSVPCATGTPPAGHSVCPYTGIGDVSDASDQDTLINEAAASAAYIQLINLSDVPTSQVVNVPIPNDNAGSWQMAALGLRNARSTYVDILATDVIWFGFIPNFLNGQIVDGNYSGTLTLEPWCGVDGNPSPPNPAPTANPTC